MFLPTQSSLTRAVACAIVVGAMFRVGPAVCAGAEGLPVMEKFSESETGTRGMTWATVQAPDGTIFVGGDSLLRFDGRRWHSNPANAGYALRGLDWGADGRLWAAGDGELGFFTEQRDARWYFKSLRSALPAAAANLGEMWFAFADGPNGAVFVSENKVLRWNGTAFEIWNLPGTRRLFATRANGKIYVHHLLTGLYVLEPAGPVRVLEQSLLGANQGVFWLEHDEQRDEWLIATKSGMIKIAHGVAEAWAPKLSALMRSNFVTCGLRLPDGRLAIGTLTGGVIFAQPNGEVDSVIAVEQGLPTASIFSLFADQEGSLWITSTSHVVRVSLSQGTSVFDGRTGLPEGPALQLVRSEGRLFAGTSNGLFGSAAPGQKFTPIPPFAAVLRDVVPDGDGLIVAFVHGLYRVRGPDVKQIYLDHSDVFAAKPSQRHPGSILLGVGRAVKLLGPSGNVRVIAENLPDIATSLAEGTDGRIWVGTNASGVIMLQPNEFLTVEPSADSPIGLPLTGQGAAKVVGLPSGAVLAFGNRRAWFLGSNAKGFVPVAGYPNREVAAVSNANDSGVWLAHAGDAGQMAAVGQVEVGADWARWKPHDLEGLATIGAPQSIWSEDNQGPNVLWVAGSAGILREPVINTPPLPGPLPPSLKVWARDSSKREALVTAPLPFDIKEVSLELANPQFKMRNSQRIETKIEGVDHDWVVTDASARRPLWGLRDGQFVIRARVVSASGKTSLESEAKVTISPPWWRTPTSLMAGIAILAAAVVGIIHWRSLALRKRNRELERKVAQRTEQLKQASAAKSRFVAQMSHDINNPVNGLTGLALALEDTSLDARQREMVAAVKHCAAYLATLTEDVLRYSALEAGKLSVRPAPFAPRLLLNAVCATMGSYVENYRAALIEITDERLPDLLLGDAGRIQQVLVNFITNAAKHAGGEIRVEVRQSDESEHVLEFLVQDKGIGLTEAEQANLFEPFSRLKRGDDRVVPGTGLGLASCRSVADLLGGSVGVRSRLNHGSVFYLRVPLIAAEPAVVAPEPIYRGTVLLVEDTNYNAWVAEAVLKRFGLTCDRARTGAEALAMFEQKGYSVVMLDRNLPDIDGTEVAKRIRLLEAGTSHAVLLAVTAYSSEEDRALCMAAGMDAFIGKPLTPESVRAALASLGAPLLATASVQVGGDSPRPNPVVDLSLLVFLAEEDSAGLGEQVTRWFGQVDQTMIAVDAAIRAADLVALRSASHDLLGHARAVGAGELSEVIQAIEASPTLDQATLLLSRLANAVRQTKQLVTSAAAAKQGGPHPSEQPS